MPLMNTMKLQKLKSNTIPIIARDRVEINENALQQV
jgi:hypothetical protein